MPLEIVRNDITNMHVDAIVNAANPRLLEGGGVCGAIFAAAGADRLRAACERFGGCAVGDAVMTDGFRLPAKHIIHAVGPVWQGGGHGEEAQLRASYTRSLELAKEHNLESIAFPLISSGIYGYPKDQALSAAISAIGSFLLKNDMDVFLVVFDADSYRLSERLYRSITAYIESRDVFLAKAVRRDADAERSWALKQRAPMAAPAPCATRADLEHALKRVSESFTEQLLRLIDERHLSDPQVYQRANLDRRLFSKIRSNPRYRPSKNTALALAVALRLNLDQTTDLLARAGYALSPASKFDLIVEYFIREGNYNIFEINEALFAFDESLLGA
ncbi:MAG: macro domain-containing protein [Clostridiales bacterium]|nr:macro domain-containing protein [Clostridiales bacterium]